MSSSGYATPPEQLLTTAAIIASGPPSIKQARQIAKKAAILKATDSDTAIFRRLVYNDEQPQNIMEGKKSLGSIDIPVGTLDAISEELIKDGEDIVQILRITEENQLEKIYVDLALWRGLVTENAAKGNPVLHPIGGKIVYSGDVDIFTARVPESNAYSAGTLSGNALSQGGFRRRTYRRNRNGKKSRRVSKRSRRTCDRSCKN